ncbi:MAG: leucine-rich repeat domain-containing protein, partial [Candidatus Riesia sp.]|nr:leucine-rich repeat domain-containing protein [Candidatus Riesia sp.]
LVDLKDKLNIDFNDWVIDIGTENEKTKLVQIGEYKFKMRDEKDQEIRHLMDVNKKTKIKPIGFGSDKKNTPLSYRQRVRQETLGFDKYFNKLNESNDNDEEEWESEEPYSNFEKEVLKIHKDEFSWNKIRYLNLYRENIDTLDGIDSFSSLKYLTIKSCRLEKLNGIENLEKLGLINVSDNFIKNLNNFNKNMDSVYELIISNNDKLGDIRGMKYFPNLNKLDISYCNIKDLDNLRYLKKLRILNCGNNIISDISPLYDLPDLMNINITNNLVSNLDRIGNLNKLNILNLNGNIVEFISGSSNSIRSLSLRDNRLKTLKGIDKYSSLESLDVCFNSNLTIRNIIWNTRNLKLKELYVSRSNNILSKYCKSRNIRLYTSL